MHSVSSDEGMPQGHRINRTLIVPAEARRTVHEIHGDYLDVSAAHVPDQMEGELLRHSFQGTCNAIPLSKLVWSESDFPVVVQPMTQRECSR